MLVLGTNLGFSPRKVRQIVSQAGGTNCGYQYETAGISTSAHDHADLCIPQKT